MAKKASRRAGRNPNLRLAGTAAPAPRKGWRVTNVWTKKLGKSFTPVSSYFLDNYHRLKYPITAVEFLLVVHLLKYKWDEAMPVPAIRTLAKCMMRSEQAVRAAARSLERKGYLRRHMTRGETNRFDFAPLFAALEELYDADFGANAKQPRRSKPPARCTKPAPAPNANAARCRHGWRRSRKRRSSSGNRGCPAATTWSGSKHCSVASATSCNGCGPSWHRSAAHWRS